MAKNDQDKSGRSLEEQLASLDAMSNVPEPAPEESSAAEPPPADNSSPWANSAPHYAPPPYGAAPPYGPGVQSPEQAYGAPGFPPDYGVHQPPRFPGGPDPVFRGRPSSPRRRLRAEPAGL